MISHNLVEPAPINGWRDTDQTTTEEKIMYKTYRNLHNSEASAIAMAEDERRRGVSCGGWYKRLSASEEAEAREQSRIFLENALFLGRNADSLTEALGG
jgi:hypothetical protein